MLFLIDFLPSVRILQNSHYHPQLEDLLDLNFADAGYDGHMLESQDFANCLIEALRIERLQFEGHSECW